jgi:hypothetical protein
MKSEIEFAILLLMYVPVSLRAQYTKPVYISLPGPGNIQHLAYAVEPMPRSRFYAALKALANESGAKNR